MALPLYEAERIKNEIESDPHIAGHDIRVTIFEPEGETAVVIEAEKLSNRQIDVIMQANYRNRTWFVDGKSEKGVRVGIW